MRLPARIEPWLSAEDREVWAREAPDKGAYRRRLAIWLTGVCRIPAHRVTELLCASRQAVWLGMAQYNQQGPEGHRRARCGGRRWAWLSCRGTALLLAVDSATFMAF
jgi:hypothetical protein